MNVKVSSAKYKRLTDNPDENDASACDEVDRNAINNPFTLMCAFSLLFIFLIYSYSYTSQDQQLMDNYESISETTMEMSELVSLTIATPLIDGTSSELMKYDSSKLPITSETLQSSEGRSKTVPFEPTTAMLSTISTTFPPITSIKPQTPVSKTTLKPPFMESIANISSIRPLKKPLATPTLAVKSQRKYYVKTSHCHIPYIDPFSAESRKIFKPGKYVQCAQNEALVQSTYNTSARQYTLHVNYAIVRSILKALPENTSLMEDVNCCYQQVVRTGSGNRADESYKLLPCAQFHQDFVVPQHIDYMIVECVSKSQKKTIQKDGFSFVQYRKSNAKISKTTAETGSELRKPSVLLIGIDSLSRTNFRRNMPLTFDFLHNSWYELQGYNKVGDNTFPNLMALLTGRNSSEAYKLCKPKSNGGLDTPACNMIWHDFKARGYHTAYAEDTAAISTFNYLKKGFNKLPTDYYLRPFVLAIEKNLKSKRVYNLKYCIGRKQYAEYIYDYALQFTKTYLKEPMFGLFWANSFSHNNFQSSSKMDTKMLEYLQTFERNGVLNESIVILFSDHGVRWGPLLTLSEGFLEERLPMFFISIPLWFRQAYPQFVTALEINQNRLTSPFDIHVTLKQILALAEPQAAALPPTEGCPTCQSLFYEMPLNRSCIDAGITEHWCTCVPYETASVKAWRVKKVTTLIIDAMNKYLAAKKLDTVCETLKVRTISDAKLKMDEEPTSADITTYHVKFTANIKEASFQATAIYDGVNRTITVDVEQDISRLSLYAQTSKCIDDKEAKKYCICKATT